MMKITGGVYRTRGFQQARAHPVDDLTTDYPVVGYYHTGNEWQFATNGQILKNGSSPLDIIGWSDDSG